MDVFKYFNQSLAADELNLVSLPLPNDPPFRLSSWVVPPTCKVMGEVTLPGEMLMAQVQFGTETGIRFKFGSRA